MGPWKDPYTHPRWICQRPGCSHRNLQGGPGTTGGRPGHSPSPPTASCSPPGPQFPGQRRALYAQRTAGGLRLGGWRVRGFATTLTVSTAAYEPTGGKLRLGDRAAGLRCRRALSHGSNRATAVPFSLALVLGPQNLLESAEWARPFMHQSGSPVWPEADLQSDNPYRRKPRLSDPRWPNAQH